MGDDELVGLADAAKETGLSREWLRQLVNRGDITGAVRVGNAIGIPRREVRRLKKQPHRPRAGWPKGRPRKAPPA
jgi:hypothetical protein